MLIDCIHWLLKMKIRLLLICLDLRQILLQLVALMIDLLQIVLMIRVVLKALMVLLMWYLSFVWKLGIEPRP